MMIPKIEVNAALGLLARRRAYKLLIQFQLVSLYNGRESPTMNGLHRDDAPCPGETYTNEQSQGSQEVNENDSGRGVEQEDEAIQSHSQHRDQETDALKVGYNNRSSGNLYLAKNVAVPILVNDGVMKINRLATQRATQHRKKTLSSRPLK
ncbi:unnamed protein product [Aspergillus oryzae var. brunneus]|uniref:Unnamed protein product n=2 Tax=Aspergillus oryzae TaxID=5062 RepID=A0AAN4YSM5_ASPOZ|nr:unnamed protein product [Aspergillus oryzae]GMG41620.1 unnamed protein product [Aspergillus oryzae var. brunneus]